MHILKFYKEYFKTIKPQFEGRITYEDLVEVCTKYLCK